MRTKCKECQAETSDFERHLKVENHTQACSKFKFNKDENE